MTTTPNIIKDAQAVPPALKQPLINLLLSLADDELILGYWDSEWTGIAPILEEDVACSSIAQDEIGHARLLYEEAATLSGITADQLAYGRQPGEYRHAQLVEHKRGDWAFTIARRYLYDTADQVRLTALANSAYLPLAQDIAKIQREEVYHQLHVSTWLQRLASLHNPQHEARMRLEQALNSLWPDALGLFEPLPDEESLLQASILTVPGTQLQQEWLTTIAPIFEHLRLPFPFTTTKPTSETGNTIGQAVAAIHKNNATLTPRYGGRQGQHTQDFNELWEQMTMVYRLEPQGNW
jgi:ring-1,2-phenylacetyl-CoA epoxidase subunit PaaC